jgi:glycine oxidase
VRLRAERHLKVVIIGAGVAGLSIGWRLRQAGVAVTILERAQPAMGATWAAAGMLAATAEYEGAQSPEAALAYRARRLWPDFAREIEAASGIGIGYRPRGALMVAMNRQEAATQAARATADCDVKPLTAEQARTMEPMLASQIAGALWAAKESDVDNRALGQALVQAFVRAGGTLAGDEAVVQIETRAGRAIAARTPFGLYEADAFILAAGAWSGLVEGLPPEAAPPVKPIKGEMLALAPPKGVALPSHVVWGNEVYLVPRDDRLLIGATSQDVGFDTGLTDAARDWLSSHALALIPNLRDWKIAEHWCSLRPGSPDGLPMLGPSAVSGLFVATGQYRNGILFAPVVADILSALVLGRPVDFAAFDPRRFR